MYGFSGSSGFGDRRMTFREFIAALRKCNVYNCDVKGHDKDAWKYFYERNTYGDDPSMGHVARTPPLWFCSSRLAGLSSFRKLQKVFEGTWFWKFVCQFSAFFY